MQLRRVYLDLRLEGAPFRDVEDMGSQDSPLEDSQDSLGVASACQADQVEVLLVVVSALGRVHLLVRLRVLPVVAILEQEEPGQVLLERLEGAWEDSQDIPLGDSQGSPEVA